jgi:hypothetical protein
MRPMQIARISVDDAGESHFDDVTLELASANYAPPAPAFAVSAALGADAVQFFEMPAGWFGAPHPTPRRQIYVGISGTLEVAVSDGETRVVGPGDVIVLEDERGKGHTTRVVSDEPARGVFVHLS